MGLELPTHRVVAFNTATASENRIHDDTVAARLGFAGGLVPGVDVAAYLCIPPLAHWGREFVDGGRYSVRFDTPVYDGEPTVISAGLDDLGELVATATTERGDCAELRARLALTSMIDAGLVAGPRPAERLPASPDTLPAGRVLGSFVTSCSAADHVGYLDSVRQPDSPVQDWDVVHPAWLLRRANDLLATNVVLGPWIHVSSDVQHHGAVGLDEEIEVRGRVTDSFEAGGHRFVRLAVLMVDGHGMPRVSLDHTAIYEPRQLRTKPTP